MAKSINYPDGTDFPRLTAADRRASRDATMAEAPREGDVWVFAYGSLMWNPCFEAADRRAGVLPGYARRFNFWTVVARGTPERPGLGLGLESARAECHGVVYRLHAERLEEELDAVWEREMYSGVYRPSWLRVDSADGGIDAIAFVVDPGHPQYAAGLELDEQAEIIARAHGKFGPCREYLENVLREMAALGVREPELELLLERVKALGG